MANTGPQIQNLSPNTGSVSGGTTVVITGVNFQDAIASVQFGSVAAPSFTVNSPTQITAISPAQGVGAVSVGMLAPGNSHIFGAATFTYN